MTLKQNINIYWKENEYACLTLFKHE